MPASFDDFIRERRYLHNVSPKTIEWYRQSFKWLGQFPLTEDGVKQFVIAMREAGLKAISCNNRIRVANAYFRWAGLPLHIQKFKEEQELLPTFAFRHTFGVEYIRAGGGEFRLQKMLGHTSLSQTRKYVELCTQDLQESHERLSLLNRK